MNGVQDERVLWPGWETVRLIGRGSFGAVYEIERVIKGEVERAAVKVITIPQSQSDVEELRVSGYDDRSVTAHFEGLKDKIEREYMTMARLKGAVNIVYCDDIRTVQHDDDLGWDIYIKMELLIPLLSVLTSPVDEAQVVKLGKDICRALVMCEQTNVVHRDIKPQNIFVAKDGTYKLGDFGVAKTIEGTGSASVRTGTFRFMAPEVYNSEHYGHKADLYSLGMVLYWMLNECRSPFLQLPPVLPTEKAEQTARQKRFRGEPIPSPSHGGEALKRIVLKACAFDPKDRYQRAEEMLKDLNALGGECIEPVATVPVKEPENDETISSHTPVNGPVQKIEKTVGPYEKTEETSVGSPATEENETVGAFSNPPQPIPKPQKKKWPAILGGLVAVLALAAGLYFLPGWISRQPSARPVEVTPQAIESASTLPPENLTVMPEVTPKPTQEKPVSSPLSSETPSKWNEDMVEYTAFNSTLYVSGNGIIQEINAAINDWDTIKREISEIIIDNGITGIGDYAFSGCYQLESVNIPDTVTSIGGFAFQGCSNLHSITIPTSVKSFGEKAFWSCTNLSDVFYTGDQSQWQKISIAIYRLPNGTEGKYPVFPSHVTFYFSS